MVPPHMRRPAALARGEPNENGDVGKPEESNAAAAWQVPAPRLAELRWLGGEGISCAAILEATKRAEDLLALWREFRRLDHRVRMARLRFEHVGLDPDEQLAIVDEVAEWGCLVKAFAQTRGRAA